MDLGRNESARGSPDLANDRAGDPGARDATRRVRATSFAKHASSSLERFGPRLALRRSWLADPRCGNASNGKRSRHRLVPARSGARAPLAREDRRLVRVCPRVVFRLQKWASVAEAQGSAYPVATERVDGSLADGVREDRFGEKASTTCLAVAKPRRRPQAGAGRSRGRRGAKVLVARKAPRADLPHVPLHAGRGWRSRRLPPWHRARKRNGPHGSRDRGVRGASAHMARGRQRPPR